MPSALTCWTMVVLLLAWGQLPPLLTHCHTSTALAVKEISICRLSPNPASLKEDDKQPTRSIEMLDLTKCGDVAQTVPTRKPSARSAKANFFMPFSFIVGVLKR